MKNIPILTDKIISELKKSLDQLACAKYRKTGLPFVTSKFAQTLDGKIATLSGDSRWISGPSSLRFAHQLRSWHDTILVGVGTIIRDNPQLTVRLFEGKNPKKIIVDSRLRTPVNSNILRGKAALSTIIATTSLFDKEKIKKYQSKGAEVLLIKKDRSNQVDLQNLLQELGQRNIYSVLVEGGSKIINSFLKKRSEFGSIGLTDHLVVMIAPKIVGSGITYVTLNRFKHLFSFSHLKFFRSGDDVILQAFIKK
jgi:diaminohydroxyphosphoribosylaminopyrimidine deaminase/5-amino-6-(5-phosphoribosylamino)uracil reductase